MWIRYHIRLTLKINLDHQVMMRMSKLSKVLINYLLMLQALMPQNKIMEIL